MPVADGMMDKGSASVLIPRIAMRMNPGPFWVAVTPGDSWTNEPRSSFPWDSSFSPSNAEIDAGMSRSDFARFVAIKGPLARLERALAAFLEMLEGKTLPALEVLQQRSAH